MKKILLGCTICASFTMNAQNFEWANGVGGTDYDISTGVVIDDNGNTIVSGYFAGTVDFDPGVGISNLTSTAGSSDMFIVKFDASGDFVWAHSFGDDLDDRANAIAVDNNGNIYVTGSFWGTIDFDPGLGTATLSGSNQDGFILKLDANGDFVWAKAIDGSAPVIGKDIAVDGAGYVYSVGRFQGTVDLDPGAGTQNSVSVGDTDGYFQKLDPNGTLEAAFSFGGTEQEEVEGIALDASSNIFITGYFKGTANFDPIGTAELTATSTSFGDIFVMKLLSNGGLDWVKGFGSPQHDSATDIAVDASGNTYTTGFFQGTIDFDPGAGTTELTAVGWADQFVLKLDALGNFVWAISNGGDEETAGYTIDVASTGEVITGGYFSGTTDFDPSAGTLNLVGVNSWDAFIQKLDASGQLIDAYGFGDTSEDCVYALDIGSSGEIVATGIYSGTVDFDLGSGTDVHTGEGGYDVFVLKLSGSVGVEQLSTSRFRPFPNPTTATLNIDTDLEINKLIIHDVSGKQLIETANEEINVDGLPQGIYLITISTDQGLFTARFIKE